MHFSKMKKKVNFYVSKFLLASAAGSRGYRIAFIATTFPKGFYVNIICNIVPSSLSTTDNLTRSFRIR